MAYQPKSYKKFVATAATATLVATAVVPAAFADEVKPAAFTDVAQQYEAAVNFVVAQNIAKGLTETTFGISADIKRGDAAIMIANAAGLNDEKAPASGFSDVPTRGVLAINSLKAAGVVNGKSTTNFGFNDSITRGEAAIMFANAFKLTGDANDVKFTDVSDRYLNAVAALVEEGVTNGISATQFGTTNNIKRGDFARFVYALEEYIVPNPEAPVLKYDGASSITVAYGETLTLPTVTATDDVDTDVEVTRVIKNSAGSVVSEIDTKVPGTYTVTYSAVDSDGNAASDVVITVVVKEDVNAEVSSVSAANAKELVIKFTTAISEDSVIDGSNTLKDGVFTINELTTGSTPANPVAGADSLAAELSEDGKTLTVTADTYFEGRYEVSFGADVIETVSGSKLEGFSGIVTVKDTAKPALSSVTYTNSNTARVIFSEPLSDDGSLTAVYSDGTSATVTPSFTAGNEYIDLDLSALTENKDVSVTFVGIKDVAGNLSAPNPVTVTVKRDTTDVTAPTVQSITPTSATSFDIKLSEAVVDSTGTILVGTTNVSANAVVDTTNPTVIHVTGLSPLSGLQTVTVNADAVRDLSGNANTAFSRVVNFDADTVDPTVVSSSVQTINNVNYLVVNFSENVTPVSGKALAFDYINENGESLSTTVTTNTGAIANQGNTTLYNPTNGVSKSIKINLTGLAVENYTVDFVEGLAIDAFANNSVAKNDVPVSIVASTVQQGINTNVDGNGVDAIDGNTVMVHFTSPLDIATANTASNYSVAGRTVEKAAINKNNSTDGYSVELTLAEGSVVLAGDYEVQVRNVSARNGQPMDVYTTTETLFENVAPTATRAVLTTPQTVDITFSEAVTNATSDTNDFVFLIGGQEVAANDVITTPAVTTGTTTIRFTLESAVTAADLAKGLSVKALSTINITDGSGNIVKTPVTLNVQQ